MPHRVFFTAAAFSFSPRSHCWNVLRRVHGYGSKFDTTCWDPSLVISRGHSAGGIHVALSKNRGYPQPFEEGDDYPLELGVPYVQIHLPKSSPSGFASHGHIGPVSGDAQKHVASSRQKTLSVLCILSNLSTLLIVQNHPIWQDTGFFLSQSQSQRLTMTQRSKKSLFWPFIWDVAKSGGHSQQVGMYHTVSCPNIRSQPTVDGDWIRYLKKGQPGGYGIKRYFA